ncbi:B-cell lymphoma 3 protein-like protein [Diplodia seriata]|uniref:B-cell lymphoma 3 protein-like protein n=1 Tax=Diplodia seriata TaxID=420778 RepID=A0A1S8BGZ3_9PEZI|nr:B-cell lymphoma 3 protein-like protein [Diplodia seriata]
MLSEDDIEVDCKDFYNDTPLLIAIREGHYDIAQELLTRSAKWLYRQGKTTGAKACGPSEVHSSPASAKGHFVDVNAENDDQETPMAVAVSSGATGVIFTLIEAGASLDTFEPAASPLLYAIQTNNKSLLVKLIENGVELNGAVYYAVARMASIGGEDTEELVRVLLEAGANIQSPKELVYYATNELCDDGNDDDAMEIGSGSALRIAADMESLPILQLLLTHGSLPPKEVGDAFIRTVERGDMANLSILQVLLTQSSLPPKDFSRALKLTLKRKNMPLPILKLLLNQAAKIDILKPHVHKALRYAVSSGDQAMVETVLNETAEIRRSESDAYGFFVAAVKRGEASMAETLWNHSTMTSWLEPKNLYGAFVSALVEADASTTLLEKLIRKYPAGPGNLEPRSLHNALMVAVSTSNPYATDLLLKWGAEISGLEPRDLQNALVLAVESDDPYMVALLLNHGVDIDDTDERDFIRTPAFDSVWTLNAQTIESQFLNQNKPNFFSGALLYYALERKYYAVFRLLLSHKASLDSEHVSPLGHTTSAPNPILVELLVERYASRNRNGDFGEALREAFRHRDKISIQILIQLIVILEYGDSFTWPPEYPSAYAITEALASVEMNDHRGVAIGIVAKAAMRGNEKLVELMLKYIGARPDSITGEIDWCICAGDRERLNRFQNKISEVINVEKDGYVAPIVVAVAFKRVSIVELLLETGDISGDSLLLARSLVSHLGLHAAFEHLRTKLTYRVFCAM